MKEKPDTPVDAHWRTPDARWPYFQKVLSTPQPKPKGGRPRLDDRHALDALFYVLRTGCQWKALRRSLGAGSTVHARFQEWQQAGVFEKLWKAGLLQYDAAGGIDWEWQALEGAMTKAPGGGEKGRVPPLPTVPRAAPNAVCSPTARACPWGGGGRG